VAELELEAEMPSHPAARTAALLLPWPCMMPVDSNAVQQEPDTVLPNGAADHAAHEQHESRPSLAFTATATTQALAARLCLAWSVAVKGPCQYTGILNDSYPRPTERRSLKLSSHHTFKPPHMKVPTHFRPPTIPSSEMSFFLCPPNTCTQLKPPKSSQVKSSKSSKACWPTAA
jgi:hypothetical protein